MHPDNLLDDEDLAVLDCFFAWRGAGMGGPGYLPFAGGYAQQPAGLMAALRHMAGCAAKLERKR